MTITLTKDFVRGVLKACPKGRRRAETCRDMAIGYRQLAKRPSELAEERRDKANKLMELARRLDANATQRSTNPQHQHQLWN